jgi:hypothetical protein
LDEEIKDAEADLFRDLCRALHVRNIREYENTQKKIHQEANEKKMKFSTSLARLENQ